jgi:hypothetical protein
VQKWPDVQAGPAVHPLTLNEASVQPELIVQWFCPVQKFDPVQPDPPVQ